MTTVFPTPTWPEAPPLTIDPLEESLRLAELRSLNLLDSEPEHRFDRITKLAAEFFGVSIAYVAFIDERRQWLKSRVGLCSLESPREMTFCQYTIHRDKPLIMPDTRLDAMGRTHPLVVGEPFVRFYAGVPLAGPSGKNIGTFCLADMAPRQFGEDNVTSLLAFATLIEREINLGEIIQVQHELLETRQLLVEAQKELEHEFSDAAKYMRMMLPPPFQGDETVEWQFHPSMRLGGDGLGYRRINDDLLAVYILDVTGHGLGSALLAVTAMELLRNPVAQVNFLKPGDVIDRLNRTFPMKDHGGKFFSAWYGVYSRSARTITYSNGGHPPPVILTREDGHARLERTAPGTSVLGVLPQIEIPEITVPFPPGSELCLFTDGLYELVDARGGRGSYDEFLAWLQGETAAGKPAWDSVCAWLERGHERNLIDDDVSMLRLATPA